MLYTFKTFNFRLSHQLSHIFKFNFNAEVSTLEMAASKQEWRFVFDFEL